MRPLVLVILLYSTSLFAQEKQTNIFLPDKGDWTNSKNWSLERSPEPGDIIIIRSSALIIIDKTVSLENVDIYVSGRMILNDAGLNMDESSRLIVTASGSIESGNKSEEERITIGKALKFSATKDETIKGFAIAFVKSGESPEGFSSDSYKVPDLFFDKSNTWNNTDSWSLGRIPQDGDSIIILQHSEATIEEGLKLEDVSMRISGQLTIEKSAVYLGKSSSVTIEKSGALQSKNGDENESLFISDQLKFDGATEIKLGGFAFANSKTGVSPYGFSSDASLPLTFTDFKAKITNHVLLVEWSTQNEENNLKFDIQQSGDGLHWENIGSVFTSATQSFNKNYSFTQDINATGLIYFRLKQIDKDLKFAYSKTILLNGPSSKNLTTVAVLSGNRIVLNFSGEDKETLNVRISNMQGNILYKNKIGAGTTEINASSFLPFQKQIFLVTLSNNKGYRLTRSFISK